MSAAPTPSRPVPAPDLAAWLGVAPFFVFAAMFLIVPTAWLLVGAFQDHEGAFTLGQHRPARPAVDPPLLLAEP